MPKPSPDYLHQPPQQDQSFDAADAMRVHGGIGLPGEELVERMDGLTANPETAEAMHWDQIELTAYQTVKNATDLPIPDLNAFHEWGINFADLETGYRAYEAANLKPELVFFPVNLGLEDWKGIYSVLRQFQDATEVAEDCKLLHVPGLDDGLRVDLTIAEDWDLLNQEAIKVCDTVRDESDRTRAWSVIVVPTASAQEGGIVFGSGHDLSKDTEALQAQANILKKTHTTIEDAHMPIGAYLTVQAMRISKHQPLMDEGTKWTWNAGVIDKGKTQIYSPAACWHKSDGVIMISPYRRQITGTIGVRLPVWG